MYCYKTCSFVWYGSVKIYWYILMTNLKPIAYALVVIFFRITRDKQSIARSRGPIVGFSSWMFARAVTRVIVLCALPSYIGARYIEGPEFITYNKAVYHYVSPTIYKTPHLPNRSGDVGQAIRKTCAQFHLLTLVGPVGDSVPACL